MQKKDFKPGYYHVGGPIGIVNGACSYQGSCELNFTPTRPTLQVLDAEYSNCDVPLKAGDELTIVYSVLPVEGTIDITCGVRECPVLVISKTNTASK